MHQPKIDIKFVEDSSLYSTLHDINQSPEGLKHDL